MLGKPISEIAKRVVENVRLPLLSPDELKEVDEECLKDRLIAVSRTHFPPPPPENSFTANINISINYISTC